MNLQARILLAPTPGSMNSITYISVNLLAFVFGQWLVTRGHWSGFLVWGLANIYSALTCVVTGIPETSCLFAAYFLANLASLRAWIARGQQRVSTNPLLKQTCPQHSRAHPEFH
jgi:hypothetical protein